MRLAAILAVLAGTIQVAGATPIDALVTAIDENDTKTVTAFVENYYRDAGISVNDTLVWTTQPFDEIVNWYNELTIQIRLSELPTPAETAAYWDNWSRVLTEGRWNWQAFFSDSAEAHRLAGFNQFLLAAHEYGHALTFRYDRHHERRGDNEINCREYPADRLAAAFLQEVAERDSRIAALRARYRELITAINAQIDPASRYDVPTFDELNADCRIMHVEQPKDEAGMTPYASAFFARHGVLLATNLPSLREIYDTYLLPYWQAEIHEPSGRAGAVTTKAVLGAPPKAYELGDQWKDLLAPTVDGELYFVRVAASDGVWPPRIRLSYGRAGEPLEMAVPDQALPIGTAPGGSMFFSTALSLGPNHFMLLTDTVWDDQIWLFSARRVSDTWRLAMRRIDRNEAIFARLAFDVTGNVEVFLTETGHESGWVVQRTGIDTDTLALTEMGPVPGISDTPLALLADGSPLDFDYGTFHIPGVDGSQAFAGSGLQGFKDSPDPMAAEIATENPVVVPDPEGGFRFIDYDPTNAVLVLRHVAPAQ